MKLEIRAVLSEGGEGAEAEYVVSTPGSVDSVDDVQKLSDAVIGVVELQDVVERLCAEVRGKLHPEEASPEKLAEVQAAETTEERK